MMKLGFVLESIWDVKLELELVKIIKVGTQKDCPKQSLPSLHVSHSWIHGHVIVKFQENTHNAQNIVQKRYKRLTIEYYFIYFDILLKYPLARD